MFVGHAAAALAAKPLAPRLSLGALFVAAVWLDILWPALLLAGVERVQILQAEGRYPPLAFVYYPWSHSLAAASGWSVAFAALFWHRGARAAATVGALVLSHWLLDALSHHPDLPLWPGDPAVIGAGLWNSVPATLLVEGALFAGGVAIYARHARARDRTGQLAFWALIACLILAYAANFAGPPPPSVEAIGYVGLMGGALFPLWAGWADRHRGASAGAAGRA